MSKVILFGGTTEGRRLADYCRCHHIETLVCVVSDCGADVLTESPWLRIHRGAMEAEEMEALFGQEKPELVVDATHPYAAVVTGNIRRACLAQNTHYIRVARECSQTAGPASKTVWVQSAGEAADYLSRTQGRVLLTTGSRELPAFAGIEGFEKRFYVRVLPTAEVIAQCRDSGLKTSQIIAMQGPFTYEMNMAVLHMTRAEYLVTKESGAAGGFLEKMEAAREAGVTVIVIGRPQKEDGVSLREAVKYLQPYGESCPRNIYLAGIGMGGPGQLTGQARSCIEEADGVAGAKRMLDSVSGLLGGKEVKAAYKPEEIHRWLEDNPQIGQAAVLYSGDPGFYSGAAAMEELLEKYPGKYEVSVIPGISTVSYLCAAFRTTWEDVYLESLHGRELEVEELLRSHKRIFLLMGGRGSVKELCGNLCAGGLGNTRVSVGMSLSYPEERLAAGTAKELEKEEFDGLCGVLLERSMIGGNSL